MSIPLPPNNFPVRTTVHDAYDTCLMFEHRASDLGRQPSPRVCARLLGCMLLYAPVETGREYIAREIVACANDRDLIELADCYGHRLIRLFKSAKAPTPSPSLHPSRPSFDDLADALKHALEITPNNQSAVKTRALARDDYRCIVTGRYDLTSTKTFSSIMQRIMTERVASVNTQAAHIFPASTNKSIIVDGKDPKCIDSFGGISVTKELNGDNIHRIENIMTLSIDVHSKFDGLNIWFEETDTPNTYRICGAHGAELDLPTSVTFTTTDARLSPPDPRYLRVHAACAKVAHLSGAGECFDRIIRDLGNTRVLSADGSSAEVLSYALLNAQS